MYRKSRLSRTSEAEDPGMNLTPLIDVVFVVLIMFIVIAPILELDKVQLANSSKDANSSSMSVRENGSISIHVHDDNTIWYNKHLVSISQLRQEIQQAKEHQNIALIQLFHDKRAAFGTYQSIKNVVEATGFEEMDVILQPN